MRHVRKLHLRKKKKEVRYCAGRPTRDHNDWNRRRILIKLHQVFPYLHLEGHVGQDTTDRLFKRYLYSSFLSKVGSVLLTHDQYAFIINLSI